MRQLVESTRNLRLALLVSEFALPWAALAQQHSRRLGGGRRWVAVGRQGERLALAATP